MLTVDVVNKLSPEEVTSSACLGSYKKHSYKEITNNNPYISKSILVDVNYLKLTGGDGIKSE